MIEDAFAVPDPVRAVWAIANDGGLSHDARLLLAGTLLLLQGEKVTRHAAIDFIDRACDLFGGMSLEVCRAHAAEARGDAP